MLREKEKEAQETVTIDGYECIPVDQWGSEKEKYLLGNDIEDSSFYYAQVNGKTFEYDHKPERSEVEDDYINAIAEEDIDRHEAEVFSRFEGTDGIAEPDETVLSPIRCKTLLDGGRRRTKNLYGVFKRTVPAGQVRQ